jgi:hypothetical protein
MEMVMSLVEWMLGRRDSKLIKGYADQLVDRYAQIVRKASLPKASSLPKAEARGYVRAKAMSIVSAAIDGLLGQSSSAFPSRIVDVVRTLSAERIVMSVMEQITRETVAAPRRRAA